MDINWSTFILEIINFIILIWILQHFLYVPIRKAILRRKEAVQKELDEAKMRHAEASALEKKYTNRLKDWEQEKERKRIALQKDLEDEKLQREKELQVILDQEAEKNRALFKKEVADKVQEQKMQVFKQADKFVTKLLEQFADQNLENKIFDLFIDEINSIDAQQLQPAKQTFSSAKPEILVKSAYQVSTQQREKLLQTFAKILGQEVTVDSSIDKNLMAGFEVSLGPLVLQLNLRDELKFFSEVFVNE